MQLGLGGSKRVLDIGETWKAVTGGSLGYRALLVGALPRVCKASRHDASSPDIHVGDGASFHAPQTIPSDDALSACILQVIKRTLQTALVWTLYEELQPAMKKALQRAQRS